MGGGERALIGSAYFTIGHVEKNGRGLIGLPVRRLLSPQGDKKQPLPSTRKKYITDSLSLCPVG